MNKPMTLNKLASKIAKREGKKHQASIGDIREILKIIIVIEVEVYMGDDCDDYPTQSPFWSLLKSRNAVISKNFKKKAKKKK